MSAQRHRRWLTLTAGLLLTGLLASVASVSFQRRVDRFQTLGVEAQRTAGVWQVTAVDATVDSGLLVADRIYDVDGQRPPTAEALRTALIAAPETMLLVQRGGEMVSVSYQRPALRVDYTYLALCLIGALYLLIGLYTLFKDPRGPGRLFFLWTLVSAALYVLSPPLVPRDRLDESVFLIDQFARTLLPALTLHLFLVFPAHLGRSSRSKRWIPFLYLPAAGLLALHADWIFTGGRVFAGPPLAERLAIVDRLDLVLLTAFVMASAVALVVRLRRSPITERRQVQWIGIGLVAGYLPFVAFYVVPRVVGLSLPTWLTLPATLPLALVPLGFAYAILRYKLWDLGSILRDAISYSIAGLIGIFGFVLINLGISRGIDTELTAVRNLLSFIAGVGIAGVLVPVRGVVASRLERLRFGDHLAARKALARLGEQLAYERDLDPLCLKLVHHLRAGLDLRQATIYLATDGGLVPVRPETSLPRSLAEDSLGEAAWRRDHVVLDAVSLTGGPTPAQQLFRAGYRYAFPLRVRNRAVGMLLIGRRADDAALSTEDLLLIRGLANQAALAIENAQLLDEVHQRLDQVSRLEAHNKGIIESSPAGIAVLDDDGEIREANHAFAAIVGVARSQVEGRPLASLLPVRPIPTPGDPALDVSYCEPDGTERHLQLSVADHQTSGDERLRVLLVQDTSERMALETAMRERERLASLGMVAAGVAHEVNTPLTGISSYAQFLLDDLEPTHPHRTILEKMERQTFRASQIVNNLLAFARSRDDRRQPVTVAQVVRECLETAAPRARAGAVETTFLPVGEDATTARVAGSDGELGQVFNNLIGNAIEAMAGQPPNRPRRLSVTLEPTATSIRVTVGDTGPGIPPERIERVFQPFFSSKLNSGGTGLGLAITHHIVGRHGGEIRVDNAPDGSGCSFVVTLPRLPDD